MSTETMVTEMQRLFLVKSRFEHREIVTLISISVFFGLSAFPGNESFRRLYPQKSKY